VANRSGVEVEPAGMLHPASRIDISNIHPNLLIIRFNELNMEFLAR